jgi:hypothetical protein
MNSPIPILLIIALIICLNIYKEHLNIDFIFLLCLLGFVDLITGSLSVNLFIQL